MEPQGPTERNLTGSQRKHLRALAHPLKAVVRVGEAGLSESVIQALDQALTVHELVKVRLLQPADKKSDARSLSNRTGSHLCGLVGHTVILYRRNEENPSIEVPGMADETMRPSL
ncbi:MAG: YhbY family RNA-binding protein [Myxococcota bacterium]